MRQQLVEPVAGMRVDARQHVAQVGPRIQAIELGRADAATGALNVPVTPDRTVAADARVFPKGALAFIETERPVDAVSPTMRPFSRFVLDQDAGGAIKTSGHIDVYFGSGAYAENAAGRMKQPGRLYYLLLK